MMCPDVKTDMANCVGCKKPFCLPDNEPLVLCDECQSRYDSQPDLLEACKFVLKHIEWRCNIQGGYGSLKNSHSALEAAIKLAESEG